MPFLTARAKLTYGSGKVTTKDSASLNVIKEQSALAKGDLNSDKLIVIASTAVGKFYFVAGDKLVIEKNTTPKQRTSVINITRTGWFTFEEFAPVGFKNSDYSGYVYYIEPTTFNGDRYYGGNGISLMRISSIKFGNTLIHAASPLAPSGIRDIYSNIGFWGEILPGDSVAKLIIPAHLEDLSGLFDKAGNIGGFDVYVPMPKIVTLGKPKKMHRTFNGAFAYGMFTYKGTPESVVFREMDVSQVTDFSYCFAECYQANPDVENWNVSNATNMFGMFEIGVDWTTDYWTRDLSGWCVSKITSEPTNFALNHPMSAAQKPVWGTCPVIVSPTYVGGYYNAISGGTKVTQSGSSQTKYLRFKLDKIPAGTVLTLKAGRHSTPGSGYYTDFTVLKANGAIDSSNGVKTRMYGDGSPDREITLTFPSEVINPTEFVIAVNIWNTIYTADKYSASCTNYVYQGTKAVVAEYLTLHWGTNY